MTGVKWQKTRTPGVYVREGARGRHYRHLFRDATARQVACHRCKRLKDAEAHQRRMLNDRPEDVAAGRIALRAVYEKMVAHHEADGEPYAPATLDLHAAAWKHLTGLAGKDAGSITSKAVSDALKAVPGPSMRDKVRRLLATTFSYAVAERYLTVSPVRQERKRTTRSAKLRSRAAAKEPRIIDEEELARLVAELPERYRALVELMAYCGLRPGEAVALQVGKLDPLQRKLRIDTAIGGFTKTGLARELVLPTVVVEMLVEHLAKFSDPSNPDAPIFPKEDGSAIDSKNAYDAWSRRHFREAARRADVNHGLSPNDLRHMAAARAIAAEADVYSVARMLGHAKPSITLDIYGFLWKGSLEAVADKLDARIRKVRHPREPGKVVSLR